MQTHTNDNTVQVDILERGCKVLSIKPPTYDSHIQPKIPTTPYQALQLAPDWMKRTWGSIPITEASVTKIIDSLERNKLMGGGDGSVKLGIGSHAWEFTDTVQNQTITQGAGSVDGPIESMCSFRAEATHLVAMISILNTIQSYVKRKKPYVKLYTDSKSVIEALKGPDRATTKNVFKDHHDIIQQIEHLWKISKFDIEIHYVKAHQDNRDDLTTEKELNIRMNDMAFSYFDRSDALLPTHHPLFFPAQRICITFQGNPVVATVEKTLKRNEQKGETEDDFESKFAIHPKMQQQIHWKSVQRTFKANKQKQSMPTKIFHKQTHTFKRSHQWGTAKTPICQLYRIDEEDDDHLLLCRNIDMIPTISLECIFER